jgi:hypothetical protein
MKTYAFVFAKIQYANRRRKHSPLAKCESENFCVFASGTRRHSSYDSSALPEIFPSAPQIFPWPLALIFLFFSTSLINKSIKKLKTSKIKTL